MRMRHAKWDAPLTWDCSYYETETAISHCQSKGQITLPAEIRRLLAIKEGDKVAVSLAEGNKAEVTLKPVKSVAEMTFGVVKPRKMPENFKQLRKLFEEDVVERETAKAARKKR